MNVQNFPLQHLDVCVCVCACMHTCMHVCECSIFGRGTQVISRRRHATHEQSGLHDPDTNQHSVHTQPAHGLRGMWSEFMKLDRMKLTTFTSRIIGEQDKYAKFYVVIYKFYNHKFHNKNKELHLSEKSNDLQCMFFITIWALMINWHMRLKAPLCIAWYNILRYSSLLDCNWPWPHPERCLKKPWVSGLCRCKSRSRSD